MADHDAAGGDESRDRILDVIRRELERRASSNWDAGGFDPSLDLYDEALGLDSVGVIEFILHCEQRFGVELPEALLNTFDKTVGDLADAIAAAGRG